MTRPYYDVDDTPFRSRPTQRAGWGLVAPQIFGAAHYQPPQQHERPACAGTDPDAFFPTIYTAPWAVRIARRVCASCPMTAECLDAALQRGEQYGIWGGTTPKQRQRIMRQRRADAELALVKAAS